MFIPQYNEEQLLKSKSCGCFNFSSRRLFQTDCDYMMGPYGVLPGKLRTVVYTAFKLD